MKSQKGLTLAGTIFFVLIIAFIVFGVVYYVRMQTTKEELEDMKTDLLLVQAKVKKISSDYILEKKDEILIGTKLLYYWFIFNICKFSSDRKSVV